MQEERRHLAARADTLTRPLSVLATPALAPLPLTLPLTLPVTPPVTPPVPQPSAANSGSGANARLPLYLTHLVGFEARRAALARATAEERLVVLRGPGGAGKTRLAVEVARSFSQSSCASPGATAAVPAALPFDLLVFVPPAACTTRAQMLDAVLLSLRQQGTADTADAA